MQELLERCTRFVDAPGIRQRLDEPEAAREKRALAGRKAIVGPQFISIQKVVVAEALSNRIDRPEEPRISGFQKFDARQRQEAGIEFVAIEDRHEASQLAIEPAFEDRVANLFF